MVALMRVVLSVSGLTVVTLVPAGPEHFASAVSIALIFFAIYSIGVWLLELKGHSAIRAVSDWGHWIDVGWFTLLIALSCGTVSIFFWYFFPILVASFRWGFVSGIRVVAVSTILFTTVGLSLSPPIPDLERQRFLIRPIYFITVGYLMAYWGGAEVRLRRRMALLQEIGTVSNPRFGVDRTLGVIMNRLILFYRADGCAIVTTDTLTGAASLRRSGRPGSEEPVRPREIPPEVAELLLRAPGIKGVVYSTMGEGIWPSQRGICSALDLLDPAMAPPELGPFTREARSAGSRGSFPKDAFATRPSAEDSHTNPSFADPTTAAATESIAHEPIGNGTFGDARAAVSNGSSADDPTAYAGIRRAPVDSPLAAGPAASAPAIGSHDSPATLDARSCEAIATALESQAFVSVPLSFRNRISGRIYLTVDNPRVFDESDVRFLKQAVDQVLPLVDNISLVNQLASTAAEEERRKIARDIHDSVIQPYVGLQIGLAGLREKLAASGSALSGDMERLMEMTNQGIAELRRQVAALKESEKDREGSLLPAVWRFASRFTEATGIAVHVEAESDIHVADRLAAEAFQMVAEGLSNVRRHTHAAHATVGLACRDGSLHLRIENDAMGDVPESFMPRSLAERAAALGGAAHVLRRENGATVVSIEVPL